MQLAYKGKKYISEKLVHFIALRIAHNILSNLASVSGKPSPHFFECTIFPFTETSKAPVLHFVCSPITLTFPEHLNSQLILFSNS